MFDINSITAVLCVVPLCLFLYMFFGRKKYNLPPGPISIPPIGHIPFIGKDPHKKYLKLGEKYGNIFSLYLGPAYTIIINEYSLAKEALNNSSLLDRPDHMFDFMPGGLGFAGNNGAEWIDQRRYVMKSLKDAGMVKNPWESDVQAETEDFIKYLEGLGGQPVNLFDPLLVSVSNNMTSIVLGKRLETNDPRREVVDSAIQSITQVFALGGIVVFLPMLFKLLIKTGISKYAREYPKLTAFYQFMRNELNKRKQLPEEQRMDNVFMDDYLNEIERHKTKNLQSYMSEKNLISNAAAMVIGGSETGRTALLWLFLAMAAYPDKQDQIHEEIDRVLGLEGKTHWMEKNKLPYTYAAVMESLRWRTVSALNVPRKASEHTKISNYDVPKGTIVIINLFALHNDKRYWKNPELFDPSRFLQEDGTLRQLKPESYAPFSIGRRNCPGEFVALMEIFHYFTAILQRFDIKPLEDREPELGGVVEGATYQPAQQKLRFVPRE